MKKIYKYDLDIEQLAPFADTLDNTELGIFMRLEWYYLRVGSLPEDKKDLYSITRAKNNKLQKATDRVVAKFDSFFGKERLDAERSRILKEKKTNSESGKLSALRRTGSAFCAESKASSGIPPNQLENNDSGSTIVEPTTTTTRDDIKISSHQDDAEEILEIQRILESGFGNPIFGYGVAIERWRAAGANLKKDVIPVLLDFKARRLSANSSKYFDKAIMEAKSDREKLGQSRYEVAQSAVNQNVDPERAAFDRIMTKVLQNSSALTLEEIIFALTKSEERNWTIGENTRRILERENKRLAS